MMRKINYTNQFKRDYKRQKKAGTYSVNIDTLLMNAINLLVLDKPLPHSYHDHQLIGDWHDHRDCHIKPDLILIYRKPDRETLDLVRLGSHSQLGL